MSFSILRKNRLLILTWLAFSGACQAKRPVLEIEDNYNIKEVQEDDGVAREIECLAATSVNKWDEEEIGLSATFEKGPVEGKAKQKYLTPLFRENFLEVCDLAEQEAEKNGQKEIKNLKGTEDTHTLREETTKVAEGEEQRWFPNEEFDREFRDGGCYCRDLPTKYFKREIFCAQEYSFALKGGKQNERCFGYFVKEVGIVQAKHLKNVRSTEFCHSHTKSWKKACEKTRKDYKETRFYSNSDYLPENCGLSSEKEEHSCRCSTEVETIVQGPVKTFFCTKQEAGSEEDIIFNVDSANGE